MIDDLYSCWDQSHYRDVFFLDLQNRSKLGSTVTCCHDSVKTSSFRRMIWVLVVWLMIGTTFSGRPIMFMVFGGLINLTNRVWDMMWVILKTFWFSSWYIQSLNPNIRYVFLHRLVSKRPYICQNMEIFLLKLCCRGMMWWISTFISK